MCMQPHIYPLSQIHIRTPPHIFTHPPTHPPSPPHTHTPHTHTNIHPPTQVVESTGLVVVPYNEYPQLLGVLLRMLAVGSPLVRREIMKVLGVIGALDPHQHKLNQARLQGEGKLEQEGVRPQRPGKTHVGVGGGGGVGEGIQDRGFGMCVGWGWGGGGGYGSVWECMHAYASMSQYTVSSMYPHTSPPLFTPPSHIIHTTPSPSPPQPSLSHPGEDAGDLLTTSGLVTSSEEYYPTVAINALMRVLKDPAAQSLHAKTVHSLFYIFQSMQVTCVPYLPKVCVFVGGGKEGVLCMWCESGVVLCVWCESEVVLCDSVRVRLYCVCGVSVNHGCSAVRRTWEVCVCVCVCAKHMFIIHTHTTTCTHHHMRTPNTPQINQ